MKNRIRLTESQLHNVIKESVKRVMKEWRDIVEDSPGKPLSPEEYEKALSKLGEELVYAKERYLRAWYYLANALPKKGRNLGTPFFDKIKANMELLEDNLREHYLPN